LEQVHRLDVNVSALGLVHKLAELDDVVVDRADEESDALIDPAHCSLVERFDNLGLDRQFQLGAHHEPVASNAAAIHASTSARR